MNSPVPPDAPAATDWTVINAPLLTMDPDRPTAEAMATCGDRIVAVGTAEEVLAAAPSGIRPQESTGTVLPGLIDSHLHLQRGGLKILHDVGPGPAGDPSGDLDLVIGTMRRKGFEEGWGPVPPTLPERAAALRRVQPLMHRLGFTGVIDPAATREELRGYQESWRRGELTMRVLAMPYPDVGTAAAPDVDAALGQLENVGLSTGFGDERLRIGGIKVYFDGEAMQAQALLGEPWPHGGTGTQRIPTADFARLVEHCAVRGWSVGVHAVGGAAVDAVLTCFEQADRRSPIAGRMWQIIHGYLEIRPQDMARAARLGVVIAAQPSITLRNGRQLLAALGDRAATMNPLRSWIDAGALYALGSDGPFFPFDPRELIWSAVTRRVRGVPDPVGPQEAITVPEALAGYTVNAARVALAGDRRGMLRPGYLADWTLLDRDPTAIPTDDLPGLTVLRTVVGGQVVYDAGAVAVRG